MHVDRALQADILETIRDRLSLGKDSEIEIDRVEVCEHDAELRIYVRIRTKRSPKSIAEQFYGLTGLVKQTLATRPEWKEFFPLIAPSINREVHAC